MPDRKLYPLLYGLRNPYRTLKSENSQDYAQKHRRNCKFMNLGSGVYLRCQVKEGRQVKSGMRILEQTDWQLYFETGDLAKSREEDTNGIVHYTETVTYIQHS